MWCINIEPVLLALMLLVHGDDAAEARLGRLVISALKVGLAPNRIGDIRQMGAKKWLLCLLQPSCISHKIWGTLSEEQNSHQEGKIGLLLLPKIVKNNARPKKVRTSR